MRFDGPHVTVEEKADLEKRNRYDVGRNVRLQQRVCLCEKCD